jgi:hypothetical protein
LEIFIEKISDDAENAISAGKRTKVRRMSKWPIIAYGPLGLSDAEREPQRLEVRLIDH